MPGHTLLQLCYEFSVCSLTMILLKVFCQSLAGYQFCLSFDSSLSINFRACDYIREKENYFVDVNIMYYILQYSRELILGV